ncbi:PilW family protein [Thioalkalicoccus limnaeus]|uniref:PilW family protein n=1 Tax=Thioalkalicoccus limnaeus TaxID=120681 RepID=A0ABV4BLC4_9GAMM
MTRNTAGRRRQRGLSLVEIMVALFVGLFLTAGILQIFAGTRQTYRFEEALSRIQENGRFALETIARDARMAGFAGCVGLDNMHVEGSDDLVLAEGVTVPEKDPPFEATPGTDLVTLRRLAGNGVPISESTTTDRVTLASNPDGFAPGHRLAIVDCASRQIEIFTAQSITGSVSITPNPQLSRSYPTNPDVETEARVYRFREVVYFVRTGAGGTRALWRREAPNAPQEMIEGVEDMEVRYLFGADYVPATAVTNWQNVDGMRISLLLASDDDNLTGNPQNIEWRGNPLTPTDTRLRQVFTTTIALRNRLP